MVLFRNVNESFVLIDCFSSDFVVKVEVKSEIVDNSFSADKGLNHKILLLIVCD